MKTLQLFFLSLLLTHSYSGFSQDGTLDMSFGDNGIYIKDFYGQSDVIFSADQLSNTKFMVIGNVTNNNTSFHSLSRFLPNGTEDNSFGENGTLFTDYGTSLTYHKTILIQNDDKIIVSGTTSGGDYFMAKHLPNGALDTTFGNNGIVITDIEEDALAHSFLQNDGKIILVGVSETNSYYNISMVRYLTNGVLDTTFGNNGVVITDIGGEYFKTFSGFLEDNGTIYLLVKYDWASDSILQILRYAENGDLDLSFGDNGILPIANGINYYSGAIALQNEGKILVAYADPQYNIYKLKQYFPNGNLDTSYGNSGEVDIDIDDFVPEKFLFQSDNSVVIYGRIMEFEGSRFCLTRYFSDGGLDTSFGENGVTTHSFESSDAIFQDNGKILGMGNTYWYSGDKNFYMARFNNSPLSISEVANANYTVFPNPSNNKFIIQHDYTTETPYQITDISGKVIQTGKLTGEQTIINLSTKQSGMYFLNTSGKTYKLIKN